MKCKRAHYSRGVVPVSARMLNKLNWCLLVSFFCGYILHFIYVLSPSLTVFYIFSLQS